MHKAQVEERVYVYFSFVWFVYVAMCSPPALHNIDFIRLWHDIACADPLNTKLTNKQTEDNDCMKI